MKKIVSVFIVFTLLFSLSLVPIFGVDWSTTDQTNLQNASNRLTYNGFSAARLLYNIDSTLSTISSTVSTISSRLFYGDHSIAYYVSAINSYMNPIYSRLQDILKATTDPAFNAISSLLGYPTTDSGTGVTSWNSYLKNILDGTVNSSADYFNLNFDSNGNIVFGSSYHGTNTISAINSNLYWLQWLNMNKYNLDLWTANALTSNYSATQNSINWSDLSTSSFTPASSTDGIYKWLYYIQAPVARLSYVLASDERIKAQEAAAANEEAVVDNFIDSSGSGSASTSDFGSVSDLSSGFKNNIATDASVSGIWNIFNSDNFGWFSQETADQLDTTGSGSRTLKSSSSYPTPLLDQQTKDILKYIGGDNND